MTTATYSDHYQAKLAEGLAFEAWVYERFGEAVGIEVVKLPEGQHNLGENYEGIEVKYDSKMHRTGNVYLEVAEKSDPRRRRYVPSGVYRRDNSVLYCIGSYQEAFCFGKVQLQQLIRQLDLPTRQTPTSIGYLLPLDRAREHAELIFRSEP
jgi:hypothetical protein